MDLWLCILAAILFTGSGIWVWHTRRQTRKIMEHMNDMLEAAVDGSFQEEFYDESLLSSIETKLAHYLAASAVSADNLTEEKEKVKQLIADISHQTKTPIANLMLYAQMLEEKELAQEEKEFVREINIQAGKLNFLIGSLVKASRLETGMLVLHPKLGFVSPMLEEVLSQIMPRAESREQTVEFVPEELPAYFDLKWTAEALGNIVDNAIKYTPGGGTVQLKVEKYSSFVKIDVIDNGIGIEKEEIPKIFGRFYRSLSVADQPGVGVGLFLAREIIQAQKGYVKVKSEIGKGSIFSVFLPV